MNLREKESLISKQERAARQQEILEKRRRARAEYNVSDTKPEKKPPVQNPKKQKRQKKERNRKIFAERVDKDALKQAVQKKNVDEEVSASQWFISICWLKIPVIGFLYALVLALGRRTAPEKKNFARGYLLYRVLVLLLSVTVLYVLYRVGLGFVDGLLSYLPV